MTDDSARSKGKAAGRQPSAKSLESSQDKSMAGTDPSGLDSAAQTHIGQKLKALYDDVVNQPIPDRFKELLEQLEKQRAASSRKGELPN